MKRFKFKVKYTDNTGCNDYIVQYQSEEEANKSIDDEFEETKENFNGWNYFHYEDGIVTAIWVSGGNEYACWKRLWKYEEED